MPSIVWRKILSFPLMLVVWILVFTLMSRGRQIHSGCGLGSLDILVLDPVADLEKR
jgi:hypothetical protein